MRKILISTIAISAMMMTACGDSSSYETKKPRTSSGYMDEEEYKPTVSEKGEYHTIDGDAKQVQYQGSQEQQKDLDAIDAYMRENPDF